MGSRSTIDLELSLGDETEVEVKFKISKKEKFGYSQTDLKTLDNVQRAWVRFFRTGSFVKFSISERFGFAEPIQFHSRQEQDTDKTPTREGLSARD
jgi:hypothetical protein